MSEQEQEQAFQTELLVGGLLPYVPYPAHANGSRLASALAAVQADLRPIVKGERAVVEMKGGGSYSYTYADLATISAAVLPRLAENGLAFTSWPTTVYGSEGARFVLAYALIHTSGERIEGEYPLPTNVSAQGLGSAITYGRRYVLTALSGVSTSDDDDDAAAAAGQHRVEQQEAAAVDAELEQARDAVRGAWAHHFGGEFDGKAAGQMFSSFTQGGYLGSANGGQLRRFAAYLSNLPQETAGATPDASSGAGGTGGEEASVATDGPKLSPEQRTKIQAMMSKLYGRDRQARLAAVSAVVGREVPSVSDLSPDEAHELITVLQADEQTGVVTGADPTTETAEGGDTDGGQETQAGTEETGQAAGR